MIKKPGDLPPFNGGGTLLNAPKITDFPPLQSTEYHAQLRVPLEQAFSSGMDVNQVANLPLFVMARMLNTIEQATAEASALINLMVDLDDAGLLDGEDIKLKVEPFKPAIESIREARTQFSKLAEESLKDLGDE